jgi:hypothetical protein
LCAPGCPEDFAEPDPEEDPDPEPEPDPDPEPEPEPEPEPDPDPEPVGSGIGSVGSEIGRDGVGSGKLVGKEVGNVGSAVGSRPSGFGVGFVLAGEATRASAGLTPATRIVPDAVTITSGNARTAVFLPAARPDRSAGPCRRERLRLAIKPVPSRASDPGGRFRAADAVDP